MPKYAALWLICALLTGCASAGKPTPVQSTTVPSWVTKPPSKHGMAYGVGSMDVYGNPTEAVQRATDIARVDLVSQLKVTITGDMRSNITETSNNQSTEMLRTIHQQVRSTIPQAEIDEIKITDTWVNGNVAHVLVELDRDVAAARLRRDIADIDAELSDYDEISTDGTTLEQLQPLLPALTLFSEREALSDRLALLSLERRQEPLSDKLKDLKARIDLLLTQLVVRVEFADSGAQQLGGSFIEALTKQGLRIQQNNQADLVFLLNTSISKVNQNKSYYVFANSRVTILDEQSRVLNSFSKQAKGMSGMEDIAEQKAAQNMAELLSVELASTLIQRLR